MAKNIEHISYERGIDKIYILVSVLQRNRNSGMYLDKRFTIGIG